MKYKIKKPLYKVYAPVLKGENVGRIEVYADNKLLLTQALVAKDYANKKSNFLIKINEIKNLFINN